MSISKNQYYEYDKDSSTEVVSYIGSDSTLIFDERTPLVERFILNYTNNVNIKKIIINEGFIGQYDIYRSVNKTNISLDKLNECYKNINKVKDVSYNYDFQIIYFTCLNRYNHQIEFEVNNNKIYSSYNGSLYTSDKQYLISHKYTEDEIISLHDDTKYLEDEALYFCPNIKELHAKSLYSITDSDMIDFKHVRKLNDLSSYITIFALNLDFIFTEAHYKKVSNAIIEKHSNLTNYIFVTPKLNPSDYSTFYAIRLVLGYLLHKDCFDKESSQIYDKYIKAHTNEIKNFARMHNLQEILKLFPDSNDIKSAKEIAKLSPIKASLYLEDRVLYGSFDDVNAIFENNKDIYFLNRALSYACRYGSLDKVELLIKNKAQFKLSENEFDDISTKTKNIFAINEDAFYALSLVIKDLNEQRYISTELQYDKDNNFYEALGAKVLDEKERLSILKFLVSLKIFNDKELSLLIVVAMLNNEELIFDYLLSLDFEFSNDDFMNSIVFKGKKYQDFFFDMTVRFKSLNLFLKLLNKFNIEFKLSAKFNLDNIFITHDVDFIKTFASKVQMTPTLKLKLVEKALEYDDVNYVKAVLDVLYTDVKKKISKLIDTTENAEIKALLVSYAKDDNTSSKTKLKL